MTHGTATPPLTEDPRERRIADLSMQYMEHGADTDSIGEGIRQLIENWPPRVVK